MGFYIRKSLRFGPLRINLSKSGVGVSTGIKGFRVGSGPRGNYIHAGLGGLYYRQTLSGGRERRTTPGGQVMLPPNPSMINGMEAIDSVDVSRLVDHSAEALLMDLNRKRSLMRFMPISMVGLLVSLVASITNPHWALILVDILLAGLTVFFIWWDQQRKTTVLFYDLQPPILPAFEALHNAFESLARSGGIWHIASKVAESDRKYLAGASSTVQRNRIVLQMKNPPDVKTNIPIMCIPAGRQSIYFFADRILVYDDKGIGSVPYGSLRLIQNATQFMENEGLPSDSQVVGSTWQYVNKDGGPDRRFRDNREIPITLYAELHFTSDTGLNELFMFSNQAGVNSYAAALNAYRESISSTPSGGGQFENISEPDPALLEPDGSEPPLLEPGCSVSPVPKALEVEPPTGSKKYYYFGQGVQGPHTIEDLESLAQQGIILAQTQVCSVDNQQWTNYEDLRNGLNNL